MPRYVSKKTKSLRRKRSRRSSKMSFKTRVLRALHGQQEMKLAKFNSTGTNIGPTIFDTFQLMPLIRQGTSAHAERIGSTITLRKLTIKGWIRIPSQVTGNGVQLGRIFILRQKNMNAAEILTNTLGNFEANSLMDFNSPYTGQPVDWLRKINKNAFVARRDLRLNFQTTTNYQGNDTSPPNPDSIKFFSISLTFGKNGRKLHYNDDTSNTTNDFPYTVSAAIHTDGGAQVLNPVFNYYTEAFYTDN